MNKTYQDLDLYKASMELVVAVYKATQSFPSHELYGLSSQIRRCAVSIPSNIAEGSGRRNKKEFIQFLSIANGSLSELETQLEIARLLEYLNDTTENNKRIRYIRSMLSGLIAYLKGEKEPSKTS